MKENQKSAGVLLQKQGAEVGRGFRLSGPVHSLGPFDDGPDREHQESGGCQEGDNEIQCQHDIAGARRLPDNERGRHKYQKCRPESLFQGHFPS